jgi:hypothetical protein
MVAQSDGAGAEIPGAHTRGARAGSLPDMPWLRISDVVAVKVCGTAVYRLS